MTRLFAVCALISCAPDPSTVQSDTADSPTGDTSSPQAPTTGLRFVHLAPGLGAVDVTVDGVSPEGWSSAEYLAGVVYNPVEPGSHAVEIAADGAILAAIDLDLVAGQSASVFWYGDPPVLTFQIDERQDISLTQRRIQLTHAAPSLGSVDVWDAGLPWELFPDLAVGATDWLVADLAVRRFGLDLDDDDVLDLTYTIPNWPGSALVDVYLVADEFGTRLVGHRDDGVVEVVEPEG